MLPHVRAKGLGPQAAMKTVAMMWRKHKSQKGAGLTLVGTGLSLAGAQRGTGAAGTVSDVAGGIGTALGAAGVAAGATGIGLAATPFLEAGVAAAGTRLRLRPCPARPAARQPTSTADRAAICSGQGARGGGRRSAAARATRVTASSSATVRAAFRTGVFDRLPPLDLRTIG